MDADQRVSFEILQALRTIVHKVSEHSRKLSKTAGMTVPQLLVLKAIGDLDIDEITVALIASHVHLSRPTVSRIVERLARAGLVDRERRSKDRRKVCLSLTTAGTERYERLPTPLHEVFIRRIHDLEPAEIDQLLGALRRLSAMMGEEEGLAAPSPVLL